VNTLYPLMLDITARTAVIVGAGPVAARKARGLIDAGCAHIRVVAPRFAADFPSVIERIKEPYDKRHLQGASLVFAATDSSFVNDAVINDARSLNIWACRADADDSSPGDFVSPAVSRAGAVVIAVSASGSPALAAAIRDHLAAAMDPAHVQMAQAMQTLRPLIRDGARLSAGDRREILRRLASVDAMRALQQRGRDGLWTWLCQQFPALDPTALAPAPTSA
jgi:siroheme synthase-like protein